MPTCLPTTASPDSRSTRLLHPPHPARRSSGRRASRRPVPRNVRLGQLTRIQNPLAYNTDFAYTASGQLLTLKR